MAFIQLKKNCVPLSCIGICFLILALSACDRSSILSNPGVTLPEQKEISKPSPKAVELNNQAVSLFHQLIAEQKLHELPQALNLLDEAVKTDPNYHQAYANKAGFLLSLKRYPEAAEAFTQAIKIRPHAGEYYIGQALALKKAGDFEKAKESCRYAIAAFNLRLKDNPNNPSRLDRAIAVFLLGYKNVALDEVNDILKKNHNDTTAQQIKEFMESGKNPWSILDE